MKTNLIEKVKRMSTEYRFGDFFRNFIAVVLGIVITFAGSDLIEERKIRNEVKDALLKHWILRDSLDQYRSVDALAIVITKHLCINRLRGTRIEKVDLEQGISIGGGENPEMKLVEEENMQEILEVIGTLPDLQQSILRMKHLEGFEVEEIARLTGSTPVAVRTNLSRARKRVKEQFMIHSKVWN